MLIIVIIIVLSYGLPGEFIWNWCKENCLFHLDIAYQITHIDIEKLKKKQKMLRQKKR